MTSMVERVARALKAYAASVDLKSGANPSLEMARAAIEAMREPSEAIKEAGSNFAYEGWTSDGKAFAKEAWQAMIDAALRD